MDYEDITGKNLGPALRRLRRQAGLPLDRVPGLSKGAISKIESGEHYPSLTTIEKLCAAYDIIVVVTPRGTYLDPFRTVERKAG